MKVLKKELTHDTESYQPKLIVTLEFDLVLSKDRDAAELKKDIGYELVKLIEEYETTYPDYYDLAIYHEQHRLDNQ